MDQVICTDCGNIEESPSSTQRVLNTKCKCGGCWKIHRTEQELEVDRAVYRTLNKSGKEEHAKRMKQLERALKEGLKKEVTNE